MIELNIQPPFLPEVRLDQNPTSNHAVGLSGAWSHLNSGFHHEYHHHLIPGMVLGAPE